MKKSIINIPEGIQYLGNYPQLLPQLPQTSFIFNKILTGCGATTLFLTDTVPTILCSPRKELIYCKANKREFKDNLHLFGSTVKDPKNVMGKINAVKNYVTNLIIDPFNPENSTTPKILVTYDSAKHVFQALSELGTLDRYRIVVDEFQTIFTDASFRGDVEIEFMHNIIQMNSVIFLSATPYIEQYLDKLPEFCSLPYVELSWPDSSIARTNIHNTPYYQGSPAKTIDLIIGKFKKQGYFEDMMDAAGNILYAREGVFFCNDVGFIVSTITRNNLIPEEVNVICSTSSGSNRERLEKIGHQIGHAPDFGMPHKPFTFVTKAAFEGTDFYSTSAYTYIFSNIRLNNLAIDISLDLPQIMGRQRRLDNPFRYSATFFYKKAPQFTEENNRAFNELIIRKQNETTMAIKNFQSCQDPAIRDFLIRKYRASQVQERYAHDYLSVVDNRNGQPHLECNIYVMLNEIRSWEIQRYQYTNGVVVLNSINSAFVNNQADITVKNFLYRFTGTFEEKMKMYSEFLDLNPGYKEVLQSRVEIPSSIKTYYNTYGSDILRAHSWKEAEIKALAEPKPADIREVAIAEFKVGWYSRGDVKAKLQSIYDKYLPGKTAKATDIAQFLNVRKTMKTIAGKRVDGYTIL